MSGSLPTALEHLLRSFAPYVREHRLTGSTGQMIELAQPAGDFSDPPVSDLVIIHAVSNDIRQRSDLGGGRFEKGSRSGDLFIVAPGTATEILVYNDHVIRSLALPAATLRATLEEVSPGRDAFDFGRLHAGPFRNDLALSLLEHLWASAESPHPASRLFADGAVLAIAAELKLKSDHRGPRVAGGLAPWQVRRVREMIEDRLADDLTLTELAALVGLSPFHFARAFKASTGLPPHRFQMLLRVERAKEMLVSTGLSITEIASECGFASSQHLAAVFRRMVGPTPSAYRREQRF